VHIIYCNLISLLKINIYLFNYLHILLLAHYLLFKMFVCLKNNDRIFLVGNIESQIVGAKLLSERQIFQVLFSNTCFFLSVRENANLTIRECLIFGLRLGFQQNMSPIASINY